MGVSLFQPLEQGPMEISFAAVMAVSALLVASAGLAAPVAAVRVQKSG